MSLFHYFLRALSVVPCAAGLIAVHGCSTAPHDEFGGTPWAPEPFEVAAISQEKELTRATSESADLYFQTGERFRELGDYENAVSNYRSALRQLPSHFEAQLGLATALAGTGEQDESVTVLRELLKAMQFESRDRKLDRIRTAAEDLLLKQDELGMALSEASDVLTDFGVEAEDSGRPENALELYKRALSLWPASRTARTRAYLLCKRNGWPYPRELVQSVAQDVFLELWELSPDAVDVKNDKFRINETKWGLPIYNQGTVFERGMWAPGPSKLTYKLDRKYTRFTAKVLVSSFKGEPTQMEVLEKELLKPRSGTVRFGVGGDGATLFESETITYSTGPVEIDVDVTGIHTLVLEVSDADGSDLLDFAVWADGRLFLKR
ncbi:MAG: NPCBM/NEW2 domain-containing protein [Verrucomicrobia bacterium]|nr:NPCBM/NEW2 domain-containing protein [Verrucomicrobiota bacterium]MDA1087303.1 NPCBM/NEW2 domain-containing protein [Verrucomicrobiota bacterium]